MWWKWTKVFWLNTFLSTISLKCSKFREKYLQCSPIWIHLTKFAYVCVFFWQLVSLHGLEADRHLLQCLFSSVDFSESASKISAPSIQNQVLLEQCTSLLNKPSFLSAICYTTDNPLASHKVSISYGLPTTGFFSKKNYQNINLKQIFLRVCEK